MNKKRMCLLMATVVTVNAAGSMLPVMATYAKEIEGSKPHLKESLHREGNITTNSNIQITTPSSVKIVRNQDMQLQTPPKLVAPITWTSSNENIATVNEDGKVLAHEKGFSIITAKDDCNNKATWKVDVMYIDGMPEVDDTVYAKVRAKWLETLIGKENDTNSENINRIIARMEGFVDTHWSGLKKDGGILWDAKNVANYKKDPAHIRTMYLNLEWLAKGYSMPESKYYKNEQLLEDIKYALEWLHENAYSIKEQYGNWWQWEIGIPKALNNICIMLFDELGQEVINKYTDVIYFYQPDPFHSGASGTSENKYRESEAANRVDVSMISLVMGVLRNDYEQLVMTRDAISSLLKYEQRESSGKYADGFYTDGSFIQHGHVPYVGTYGNVFLTGASTVVQALEDSEWEVPKEKLEVLTSFALNSFAPFIYKGAALDMVRGRAIARNNETDRNSGHNIMGSFLLLSEIVDEQLANELKTYAKSWILEDTSRNFTASTNNIKLINLAESVLNDTSIAVVPFEATHKHFGLMDRTVHRGTDYLLGVSMFSSRISNYEYMNGENLRGWHTSDGMTYLYNNDLAQYSDNYWNTVNPYRLPGTTVDTIKLDINNPGDNASIGQKLFSKEDWIGGSQLGAYGVSGMQLNGDLVTDKGTESSMVKYKSLQAKKSYFMFDDEIVMLGSDINSTEGREIETIIENRKIKDDATNRMIIDGKEAAHTLGQEETIQASWAYLEGNVQGAEIGYYFPSRAEINVKKVANTGKWADVKKRSSEELVTKNYVEMWLSHGVNPVGKTYDYVLLPGKSQEEVAKYAVNPNIEILSNTPQVQAVKEKELGILAANFWEDEVATVDNLTVNKKASVMKKQEKNMLEVAISDPTMKNTGKIEVEINQKVYSVIRKSEEIEITSLSPTIKFSVDVSKAEGKTFSIKFNTRTPSVDNSGDDNTSTSSPSGSSSSSNSSKKEENVDKKPLLKPLKEQVGVVHATKGYIQKGKHNQVGPNQPVTREEVAQVIYNLAEDANKGSVGTGYFEDLANEKAAVAINYLHEKGIVNGDLGKFMPQNSITRAEFAKMIVLATQLEVSLDVQSTFKDVKADNWAVSYITAMHQAGYVKGDKGNFRPNDKVTRAEMVAVINRVLGKTPVVNDVMLEAAKELKTDIKPTHWAFADLMEASVEHKYVVTGKGLIEWVK